MNPDNTSAKVFPAAIGYVQVVGDGPDVSPTWEYATTVSTYVEPDDEITQLADIIQERSKAVMVNAMFREVLERISYMDDEQCVDQAAYLAEEILKRADKIFGDD